MLSKCAFVALTTMQNMVKQGLSSPIAPIYGAGIVLGMFILTMDFYWVVKCLQKLRRDNAKRRKAS